MESANKKKRKSGRGNIIAQYAGNVILFLVLALVVTVAAVLIVNKTATETVHKVEAAAGRSVCDVEIADEPEQGEEIDYGHKVGTVVCENKGLNCNIYYGLNRASNRYGAGVSNEYPFFGEKGCTVVCGYDETYLAGLKYIEKGDIITFISDSVKVSYKVTGQSLIDKASLEIKQTSSDTLLMYSLCSDFSGNSDKVHCVTADRIDGEAEE